jgi:hypothetical protein
MKIAIAIENDNYSQDVRNGILEAAKKYDMHVVIDEKLPPDLNDMSTVLAKVRALRPDALMVSGHDKGAILGVREVAAQKVYVPMLATTQCDSAQIIKKFGKDANYTFCPSQWDHRLTYTDRWFGTPQKYADLFNIQGRLALAQGDVPMALYDFNAALHAEVRPEAALEQAAILGSAGFPCAGLAHLELFSSLRGKRARPRFGMARIHEWLLQRQGYWPHEIDHIRAQLLHDAKQKMPQGCPAELGSRDVKTLQ